MKKRNILAILAALAVVLVAFAACGEKEPEQPENPTVIGADGQVYEEITEVVTEIVTEIVTDKQGEAVTDKEGKTEVKTEVLTTVVTVTKPYETTTKDDGKQDETTSADNSAEVTESYENETFPEGTDIEIELDKDGKPKELLMQDLILDIKDKKSFTFNATFVTGEIAGFESGMAFKMYSKGNNTAMEMGFGPLQLRFLMANNKMYYVFPRAKAYIEAGDIDGTDASSTTASMDGLWDIIDPNNLTYVNTTKVTLKGNTYICEEYGDANNINKYYFNSNKQLKRIEMITDSGESVIIKVSEFSSKVDEKVFSVKGYSVMTEEQAEAYFSSMAGSLGALEGLM